MNWDINNLKLQDLEREYREALKKEMNILNEEKFRNLESFEQWQYIQNLEENIKTFSKDITQEVKKLSLQPLRNLEIFDFVEENQYWKLEQNSQWSYVNSLAKKDWDLRIKLRHLKLRPLFRKLLEATSKLIDNSPEFKEKLDEER